MFDVGWSELVLIVVVAVFAIGPKELPQVMYGLGRMIRRLQYMRFALSSQFDDFMREADLEEMRNAASHRKYLDLTDEVAADADVIESEDKKHVDSIIEKAEGQND